MSDTTFQESIDLLRTRRFGTFWFASLLSNIGTWAQQVAQPWLLLSLGASSFLLGLDAFALSAPVWLLTLIGGALADRADRRRVIARFQSIQMLCPTLLTLLLLFGKVEPWMIISLSVVVGVTEAHSLPSVQSNVPSIVEPRQIAAGLALNSTQFNISRILGPAIAGVLLVSLGAAGCFAMSAASYIPFIMVALWILPRRSAPAAGEVRERGNILAGARKILRASYLRGAYLTVFFSSLLCAQLVTFTPILVKNSFGGNAGHFSIAIGAFGVGGLLGAVALLFVDARRDRRHLTSWFAGGYGIVLVLAALDPWFWALPVLLAAGGFAMSVSNISANTLLQANTDSQLRGQTVSLYMLAMRGGLSVGGLVTGLSANLLGVTHALMINGALAVAIQLLIAREWFRSARPDSRTGNAVA